MPYRKLGRQRGLSANQTRLPWSEQKQQARPSVAVASAGKDAAVGQKKQSRWRPTQVCTRCDRRMSGRALATQVSTLIPFSVLCWARAS